MFKIIKLCGIILLVINRKEENVVRDKISKE